MHAGRPEQKFPRDLRNSVAPTNLTEEFSEVLLVDEGKDDSGSEFLKEIRFALVSHESVLSFSADVNLEWNTQDLVYLFSQPGDRIPKAEDDNGNMQGRQQSVSLTLETFFSNLGRAPWRLSA